MTKSQVLSAFTHCYPRRGKIKEIMKKRKLFVAGNWKMNTSQNDARVLVEGIRNKTENFNNIDIACMPPFVYLFLMKEILTGTKVKYGGQNMYYEEKGAYTGEVSPLMLRDLDCAYVIIGHSERRKYFSETDDVLNKKLKAALKNNLLPIFCLGETQEERDGNLAEKITERQLINGLAGVSPEEAEKITIAYEPVWAIGTGKNATPEQAQEMHKFLRGLLEKNFGKEVSQVIRIQYGGSVTPDNVENILIKEDIDGALVGGASLKIDSFIELLKKAEKIVL